MLTTAYAQTGRGVPGMDARGPSAAALIAGAQRTLYSDPDTARAYLGRLAALLTNLHRPASDAPGLFPQLAASASPSAPVKGGLASWQFRRVVDHIENRLGETIAIETLAAATRLSSGHFFRAFKVTAGETPHAFVIRQRIRRAQKLMLETNDSLSQIACACGLTDQAHLTRLFRRTAGGTPLVWRRTWQHSRHGDRPPARISGYE